MSKQSRGAALPPVFALRVSTGSQLLGNSKLLAQEMNTFPGSPGVQLGSKSMAADGNTGKGWGAPVSVRVQRQKKKLLSVEPTGKAGTLQTPNTILRGSQSNGPQDTKG